MRRIQVAVAVVVLAGCGVGAGQVEELGPDVAGQAKQDEAWSAAGAPTRFTADLEQEFAKLPLSGAAQVTPWPGSYWPVYEDSINFQWDQGADSPAAKYGKAFNVADVENKVSKAHGIDAQTNQKECTESSQCDSALGETCAKRRGADKGRCIPTWWGICHAWTPASILLPEPKRPVTRNGVTFKVQDLKALASLVHNSTTSKFVSLRCNTQGGDTALDAYGRVVADECRDTNPGTYHLLLANYLGLKKQAFAEDRVYDHEVWNQPLRAFRVTEQRAVDFAEANRLVGATSAGGTTVNKTGTVKQGEWAHQGSFAVNPGSSVKVVMSGSGDADLFVRFGAAPTTSTYDCRPYAGGSAEVCELVVPQGQQQVFVSVNGYAATSDFTLAITTGGAPPTAYQFNANAVSFVYVKSEVDYISEASSSTDGNLSTRVDQFTHTDRYEYVLELDARGWVIGGEWVGSSKQAHPDFLWLPTGVSGTSVAGGAIQYAVVKDLVLESVRDESQGQLTEQTKTESGTVTRDQWVQFGPFDAALGTTLTAVMTGTGDADLYVRRGLAPTATAYDCRPYQNGSNETCTAAGGGPMFIAVHGYAASSTFTLNVKWTTGAGSPGTVTPPAFAHLNEAGSVAQGELKVFRLAVPAGKKLVLRTTAPNDVDLYVRMDLAPTVTQYDQRGYTSSGNETVTITAPRDLTLFVGVHGYVASPFTVKSSDE